MKGKEFATIRKPPNHKLFDVNNKEISPVLQRCMANQAQSQATPLAPVFNITLGNEFVNILRPPAAAPAMMPPAQAIPPAPPYTKIPSFLLLHPS